jgi:CubicO group peptidase (beta-lactamase class C family)
LFRLRILPEAGVTGNAPMDAGRRAIGRRSRRMQWIVWSAPPGARNLAPMPTSRRSPTMAATALVPLSEITFVGSGLVRPECVLTTSKGEIFAGDHAAGIVEIGKAKRTISGAPPGFLPNGVTMLPDRQFLLANLGPGGGVWRLDHDWRLWPHLFEADGELLRVCNFVGRERDGTTWISVSTRTYPRERAMRPVVADGFIVRQDADGSAAMVADGLGFTNECRVDPSGQWLYVNETQRKRTTRFPIRGKGLGPAETVYEFGPGEFPDGFAFDGEGGVWVACVVSNRVIRIDAKGKGHLIVDDSDEAMIAASEAAQASGQGGREWLEAGARRSLRNIASVAFGGPDLKTVYLGCLKGDRIATFRSPIAGAEPPQWRY